MASVGQQAYESCKGKSWSDLSDETRATWEAFANAAIAEQLRNNAAARITTCARCLEVEDPELEQYHTCGIVE